MVSTWATRSMVMSWKTAYTGNRAVCVCVWSEGKRNFKVDGVKLRWSDDQIPVTLSRERFSSVQFSSVAQSCLTLCDPMNRSTPGLPVHHKLPEFTQTQAHRVSDAIQPSRPLLSPSPPTPNPSQHQGLFQWVSSSHEVAKVLEFQFQHQSFQ